MSELTMPADWDRGPRVLFNKVYFWALEDGVLKLLPGFRRPKTPAEEIVSALKNAEK